MWTLIFKSCYWTSLVQHFLLTAGGSSVCRGPNLGHLNLGLGDYMRKGEIALHPSFRGSGELRPKNRLELDMAHSSMRSCCFTETVDTVLNATNMIALALKCTPLNCMVCTHECMPSNVILFLHQFSYNYQKMSSCSS